MINDFLQFDCSERKPSTTSRKGQSSHGFTLVEMIVAVAVAVTFMGGMFLNRGSFDSGIRLDSVARDVALLVRQAQTYGAGGGSGINVGQPHGAFFDAGNPNEAKLYVNASTTNKGFDSASADQMLETITLANEYKIDDFCLGGSGMSDCSGAAINPGNLSIYFERPILDANFYANNSQVSHDQALIEIIHKSTNEKEIIKVDSSGFISTP